MFSLVVEFSQFSSDFPLLRRTLLWGSISLGLSLLVKWFTTPKGKYPPGPKGIPIFGNTFQLPPQPWYQFTEWKKTYGSMVFLQLLGQPMLVLNDHKVVVDLLDRRAPIYSDRPRNIICEILTGGYLLPFSRYGDLWRRMRRTTHEALNTTVAPKYHPIQQFEAILLTNDLLKDAEHWGEHVRRASASMVTSMVYDMPPLKTTSDPSIATVLDMADRLARAAAPGSHLVEILPILNYLPSALAKWKRESEKWFSAYSKVFVDLYSEIEGRVLRGEEQRPSFCATVAETTARHNMTNVQASWLAATMYVAGADTSANALAWFMLAMTAFPHIQRKAQAELDEVVGRTRPPSFSDWDHLPYLRALVKEVIRWRPAVPLAVPHATTEDDWYEGYFIPKGTIIAGNVWAMNLNTDLFGLDAADFNPSRHLDEHGKLKPSPDTREEGSFGFGFGRRICVGRSVANNAAFIQFGTILWALTLAPVKDAHGKYIQPEINRVLDDGLLTRPVPFRCTATARFPEVEGLLAQAKDEAASRRDTNLNAPKPIAVT